VPRIMADERKSVMGYFYEEMDKATEEIMK
jgi:hypothetical protein